HAGRGAGARRRGRPLRGRLRRSRMTCLGRSRFLQVLTYCVIVAVSHLLLYSFPTRRSSDLSAISTTSWPRSSFVPWPATRKNSRSEEHTSELQSQSNLVCRLLLEKKNSRLD